MNLQRSLVKMISQLKNEYDISLIVVIDGLMPKFVNDK